MPVLILQHVDCETAGTIEALLIESSISYRYVRTVAGESLPDSIDGWTGLIVMGGPMGVYESEQYPSLLQEMALIHQACERGVPVLGVCLGSQLLAASLGAPVTPGARKEIGWHEVVLRAEAADDALFRDLPERFMAFHWHGDVFTLPEGAVPLARSSLTPLQAFRWGNYAYGILFHLETTAEIMTEMTACFVDELRQEKLENALTVAAAAPHLPPLVQLGRTVFSHWLSFVARD
jgi:GMP synthase (glutamine-hydrolysing)